MLWEDPAGSTAWAPTTIVGYEADMPSAQKTALDAIMKRAFLM